jgi:hypothetical protein
VLSKLFAALAITVLPAAAFSGTYVFTEHFFRWKLIPLPFEPFGVALGTGSFFWTLSLLILVLGKGKKKKETSS